MKQIIRSFFITIFLIPAVSFAKPQLSVLISPNIDISAYEKFFVLNPLKPNDFLRYTPNISNEDKTNLIKYSNQTNQLVQENMDYEGIKVLNKKGFVQVYNPREADFYAAFGYSFGLVPVQNPAFLFGSGGLIVGAGESVSNVMIHGVHIFFIDKKIGNYSLRGSYYKQVRYSDAGKFIKQNISRLASALPKKKNSL